MPHDHGPDFHAAFHGPLVFRRGLASLADLFHATGFRFGHGLLYPVPDWDGCWKSFDLPSVTGNALRVKRKSLDFLVDLIHYRIAPKILGGGQNSMSHYPRPTDFCSQCGGYLLNDLRGEASLNRRGLCWVCAHLKKAVARDAAIEAKTWEIPADA